MMNYAIIAAGEGSRLRQEGITTPKPLVEIDGSTLLDRLIAIFRRRPDCESVSVIVNPQTAALSSEIDADNLVVDTTPGSMHSLSRLAPFLKDGDAFCLTTVDTVFNPDEFDRYMDSFVAGGHGYDGYMGVTTYIDDEKPLYVATDADNTITGFFDLPVEGVRYVSGGIYTLPVGSLSLLEECMAAGKHRMRDFQRALIASGLRLKAWPYSRIIDIDHATDIDKASRLINQPL